MSDATHSLSAATLTKAIEESEFLSGLAAPSRDHLLSLAANQELPPGATLIEQGASGDAFYVLGEGEVRVTVDKDGEANEVALLGPGAVLGEISLISGRARTATCTVTEAGPAKVIRIAKADLDAVLADHPDVRERLSRVAVVRAQQTMRRLYS